MSQAHYHVEPSITILCCITGCLTRNGKGVVQDCAWAAAAVQLCEKRIGHRQWVPEITDWTEGHALLSTSTMQGILGTFFKKWRAWKRPSPWTPLPLLVCPVPGDLSSWTSKHWRLCGLGTFLAPLPEHSRACLARSTAGIGKKGRRPTSLEGHAAGQQAPRHSPTP